MKTLCSPDYEQEKDECEKTVYYRPPTRYKRSNLNVLLSRRNIAFSEKTRQQWYKSISDVDRCTISTITRAGVIPYTIIPADVDSTPQLKLASKESSLWFAVGIDADFTELTDFGGYYKNSRETVVQTAARELAEESMGFFSNIHESTIKSSPVVTDGSTCIFFAKIDFETTVETLGFPDGLSHDFSRLRRQYIDKLDDIDNKPRTRRSSRKQQQKPSSSPAICDDTRIVAKTVEMENSLIYWISSTDLTKLIFKKCRCSPAATGPKKCRSKRCWYTCDVNTPNWMSNTNQELVSLGCHIDIYSSDTEFDDDITNCRRRANHPNVYNVVQKLLLPVWGRICSDLFFDEKN
jgi:hypothetical protein